jgi:cytoskeletal protein CcmA (bactofilin family)
MSAEALLPGRAPAGPPPVVARVLVFRCPQCRHQPSVIADVRDGKLMLTCEQCGHDWTRDDRRTSPERRRIEQPIARERREAERRRIFPGRPPAAATDDPAGGNVIASTAATFGPSIRVRGSIAAEEDILLNGPVDGTVSVPGHTVTIGETGHVTASIDARNVVVYGRVQGHITAAGRIALKPGAHVEGDLVSRLLAVADGAIFTGRVYRPAEAAREAERTAAASPE